MALVVEHASAALLVWVPTMKRIVMGAVIAIVFGAGGAWPRDLGQWQNTDPAIRDWYEHLMQPDQPTASCCGEADAYWCDDYYARDGKAFCRITDDRPTNRATGRMSKSAPR